MKKHTYNVITADGINICPDCETRHEAFMCLIELVKLDKQSGVFQSGYYHIEER